METVMTILAGFGLGALLGWLLFLGVLLKDIWDGKQWEKNIVKHKEAE